MFVATLLALVAAQDAPPEDAPVPKSATVARPAVAPDGTQRWSVLVDPCASVTGNPASNEIVVCGSAAASIPRLPLPADRGPPDRPMPSNPYLSGSGALAAVSSPCTTLSQGCRTGIDLIGGGTALVRLLQKVVSPGSCCETPGEATNPIALVSDIGSAVGGAAKGKPDKSNRIPIPLDDVPVAGAPARGPAAHGPP